jgi:hypothetical protein
MNNEELSLLLGMSDQLQAAVYNGTFKQVERNTKQYKQGFFHVSSNNSLVLLNVKIVIYLL